MENYIDIETISGTRYRVVTHHPGRCSHKSFVPSPSHYEGSQDVVCTDCGQRFGPETARISMERNSL